LDFTLTTSVVWWLWLIISILLVRIEGADERLVLPATEGVADQEWPITELLACELGFLPLGTANFHLSIALLRSLLEEAPLSVL
jgi:hypothetical protein